MQARYVRERQEGGRSRKDVAGKGAVVKEAGKKGGGKEGQEKRQEGGQECLKLFGSSHSEGLETHHETVENEFVGSGRVR